ncbi:alpha/beta hydrolase [Bombiscardovia coagulans]|uniref:Alpha/beta hydrolase n=1 Tax=Bombiscardovia coagulans TaxID=686666 RepID=A0A261ER68_9BIFI|nr:alpha/beta hydrolase [Bombiscardovia coagulans]OZG49176.1 alpha/beta hydrolase [Bombiscardovia coagulans]
MGRPKNVKHRVAIQLVLTFTVILSIITLLSSFSKHTVLQQKQEHSQGRVYLQEKVPTFFLHGWNGSYKSETSMVSAAIDAGVTKWVLRVDVDGNGEARLLNDIPVDATNPLIEVSFLDNTNSDYQRCASWFKSAILAVRKHYIFNEYNVVAHSMGNMVLMNYLKDYSGDSSLPRLRKQVDLAGNFNGIIGWDDEPHQMKFQKDGSPLPQTSEFTNILPLRSSYPYHQVDILNVYGDIGDGSQSDGNVTNASSKALHYIVVDRAKSYKELLIRGNEGQHSNLHESNQVCIAIIQFIWGKQ